MTHHALLTPICGMLGLALLLAGMSPVHGAEAALTDIFADKIAPLSVQLKDLNADWCRMVVTDQSRNTDLLMMMKMTDGNTEQMMLQTRVYYTAGQVLTIENERFLAVYSEPLAEDAILDLMQGGKAKAPAQLTPDTVLTLTLLSTRAISAMRDIRPFNLEQELNRGGKMQQAMEDARQKALQTQSIANLRQIGVAILMQVQDNKNQFPALDKADALQQLHLPDLITRHPVTNDLYRLNANLAGRPVGDFIHFEDKIIMVYEATPWPKGHHYAAFMDGHVAALTAEQWVEAMKDLGINK